MNDPNYEKRYQAAQKRVKELRDFYVHVTLFILVNGLMLSLDLVNDGHLDWTYWVAIFWGGIFAIHALDVIFNGVWGPEWEDRKLRQLMGETPLRGKRKRRLADVLPDEDEDFAGDEDTLTAVEEESSERTGVSGWSEKP